MSVRIITDVFTNQLKAAFDGEPWYGDSISKKLNGVSEEQAFAKPNPAMHSVAELVSHIIFWRLPLIKRLQGDFEFRQSVDDENNWLLNENLRTIGWNAIKEKLSDSQKKLLTLLTSTDDAGLQKEFLPGYTLQYLLQGVIEHDIYHLGQVALAIKLASNNSN